jgi:hypothetical protein
MKLSRGEALALAKEFCCHCQGGGIVDPSASTPKICGCVWRAIFRACYERFRFCNNSFICSRVSLDTCFVTHRKSVYSLKATEYVSDFVLIARRHLSARQYDIFKFHVLLGVSGVDCARKLDIDRGAFYAEIYRIQQALGKAYLETEPHGLYPISNYFSPGQRAAA